MRATRIDLYGVLGVARSASAAELRRAYRRLALAHHPDRAGAASAATFAGIADAYRVLSNAVARAAYDASLVEEDAWRRRDAGAVHAGGVDWTVGTNNWRTSRARPVPDQLARLSGRLDELVAAQVARVRADGVIELGLNAAEAASGGTAVLQMSIKVFCASCGGVARPRGVWCRLCQYEGTITEEVTVLVPIPSSARSGSQLKVPVNRAVASPLRIRLGVQG